MVVAITAATVALGCGREGALPPHTVARVYDGRPPVPPVQLSVQRTVKLFQPDVERTKDIRLDAQYGVVDLGPAGKFVGWSFGGVVPGPTVRTRVGDRIRLTMTNRSDERVQALHLPEVAAHSFDAAGVVVDKEDAARTVGPGQTLEVELTAVQPGIHLYRGGATDAAGMASGAFGMLIVEPEGGFGPAPAREYAIVQSELYAKPDPEGRRAGDSPLQVADLAALEAKRPTNLAYDGAFAPNVRTRVEAEPGERVRFFLLNAGLNVMSRFQTGGVRFDRAWPQEVVTAQPNGGEVALLAPAQGAIVDVVIPKKGRFTFGDQQLGFRGLSGVIDASGGEPEPRKVVPTGPLTAAAKREQARALFAERCVQCHVPPPGMLRMAPDLTGISQRHPRPWLVKWLTNPPKMQAEDPDAQALLREWNNVPMPDMALSPEQVEWLADFLIGTVSRGDKAPAAGVQKAAGTRALAQEPRIR